MPKAKRGITFCCGMLSLLFTLAIIAIPRLAIAQAKLKSINVRLTIRPPKATLFAGETQVFVAKAAAGDDSAVVWSVDEEDGGTITTRGVYTAPKVQGVCHVTARNTVNAREKASAIVTVVVYYDVPINMVRP